MLKKILGINTEFESLEYKGFTEIEFSTKTALFGYDIVIIDTSSIPSNYSTDAFKQVYQNKRLLSENSSCEIIEDANRIKEQLIELLKQGRNIFVLLGNNDSCYLQTGQSQSNISITVRRTSSIISFDTYSFLPINVSLTHLSGDNVECCCTSPYKDFFEKAINSFAYQAYFSEPIGQPLMKAKGSNKIISTVVEYENGKIVFLPHPYYEDYYEDNPDLEEIWEECGKNYLEGIIELNDKLILSPDNYSLPEWANSFSILNEINEKETLKSYLIQRKDIEEKIQSQENKISGLSKYKALVTSSGTLLEDIVKQVLVELGLSLTKTEPGRSDVIAKYEEKDIVIEIKGVRKSAAEKHAAQLEKWASLFFEEQGKLPKALLIVNAFCNSPISERNEDIFPRQMLKYSKARGHALISTTQLLCLYIEVRSNPECKKERIKELISTIGVYFRYKNIGEYLVDNSKSL